MKNPNLETDIVQCLSCGFLYPNPMPNLDPKEVQDNFKDPECYFDDPIDEKRIKKYEELMVTLEKLKPAKGNLLDVGCGRGELVYVAKKRNWNVQGTEISESFAQYTKEKFDIEVLRGDINDLNLSKGSFDVACLNSVIQYVHDPMQTLKKINSLLKKSGILYIEVTNENALIFKITDLFKSLLQRKRVTSHLSPLFPSFQIYGFNRKSLSEALKRTNFAVSSLKIKGLIGGGKVKGRGMANKLLNFIRKIAILAGGLMGKGHLIYCIARRK